MDPWGCATKGYGARPRTQSRLGRARKTDRALVGRESGGHGVVHDLVELLAVVEGIDCRIDGSEKFDENFAGMDDQGTLFHNAVSAGAGHRHDRHSCLDGHDDSPLLELLEAAIGAARTFGVDEKRLS